ncbi:MAG TPA: class I SAM-dependent methyltransferase [Anaeromyxobacteraceae bacterium]|nr:class I SAM-dependent methyltransferase [Anaeromyxobacteraceae bacterium]
MNERAFQFFLQFHHGLLRKGPGTDAATAEAFRRVEPLLPPSPSILDVGCGGGAQTLVLAPLTPGTLLAVDSYPPFIEELRERLAARGLSGRVTARVGDMKALGLPPGSFDLAWCEGALFVLGFEEGLRTLRPLLRGPGVVVATEAAWLRPVEEVPPDVRAFWAEGYPAITDVEGNLALARRAGFATLGHFTLPAEGWAAYVDPLERHMEQVLAANPGNPDAEEAARSERREFAMFRQHLGWFGYEFFLLQRG